MAGRLKGEELESLFQAKAFCDLPKEVILPQVAGYPNQMQFRPLKAVAPSAEVSGKLQKEQILKLLAWVWL